MTRQARSATIGRNDTRLASQGFSSETRRVWFIGGPHACSAPAISMIGESQTWLIFCISQFLQQKLKCPLGIGVEHHFLPFLLGPSWVPKRCRSGPGADAAGVAARRLA